MRRSTMTEDSAARARLAEAGVVLADAAWASLPEAARQQLIAHPVATEVDRQALRQLAAWLSDTFPPGWYAAAE